MAKVHEITVWARGVIMDKEGRDIINIFAKAAQMDGKHAQAFDNYEDLPDRVLVTVRKYVRLSDEEIEHKYVYTNDQAGSRRHRRGNHHQRYRYPEGHEKRRDPHHQLPTVPSTPC